MPFIETRDNTQLFYRDWGIGRPVVFCAGWTLSSDMWRGQMLSLTEAGQRCIAYDRRGHGRSDDPGGGYDYDTLADDLNALLVELDLEHVCLVGHSMAGGELVRSLTRHGSQRIDRLVFIAPVAPKTLVAADNPDGLDAGLVEAVRNMWRADFGRWAEDNADAYFATPPGAPAVSREIRDWTIRDMQRTSFQALFECSRSMIESDWRTELTAIDVPALFLHGDRDASIPLSLSSAKAVQLVPTATLEIYEHAGHGLYVTHADRVSADILSFTLEGAGALADAGSV